jgi:hypothetical protein
VKAISVADTSKSASSTVVVTPAPSITTTSLPNGAVDTAYSATLQASGGAGTLHWSVTVGTLPSGLSLNSSTGAISGTPSATGTSTFTVNVTDSAPTPLSAQQQLSLTINPPPLTVMSKSLPNGAEGIAYAARLQAISGTAPYAWSAGSGFPTWATLNSTTGAILGPTPTVGTSTFTVTVTDSSTPTPQTATQSLTLTINPVAAACTSSGNEAVLNGKYAFSLSGFNAQGFLAVVGSFTANGAGAITAGEATTSGVLGGQGGNISTFSSYSVGSDNRGCATLFTPFGTFITRFALGSLSSNVATEGRMIEWDAPSSSAFIASGTIRKQTPADFTAGLSGSYAFEESGVDNGRRVGGVGVISASSGSFTTGELDINDGGNTGHVTGVTGTYTSPDTNGFLFAATTWTGQSSPSYAVLYMVSSSQALLMTANDPISSPVMAGEMKQQSGTFSDSSVNGNVVFSIEGVNGGGSGGRMEFGLVSANGSGSLTATIYSDTAGAWDTPNPATPTCTYSVALNGRMTLGGSSCGSGSPVFYLTGANTGFMLSKDSGVEIGQVEPQAAGPFNAGSVSGALYFGYLEVVNQSADSVAGVITLNGSGGYSAIADETTTTNQRADHDDSGTITVHSDGTLSDAGSPGVVVGIIISSTKVVTVSDSSSTYPAIQVIKQ